MFKLIKALTILYCVAEWVSSLVAVVSARLKSSQYTLLPYNRGQIIRQSSLDCPPDIVGGVPTRTHINRHNLLCRRALHIRNGESHKKKKILLITLGLIHYSCQLLHT